MKRKITLIELVSFEGIDETDNERIEDRYIVGYFFNQDKINDAILLCKEKKEKDEEIVLTEYEMECSPNQKYVYVLSYEYTIIVNDQFQDFYYIFEPQSSKRKCFLMKQSLTKDKKYQRSPEKIYEDNTIDGFYIAKMEIDCVFTVNYH